MGKIYDLIVVGAGPAGSTAAMKAAERGLEVLLVDKHQFPRNKTCGGYLSRKTLDLLESPLDKTVIEQEVFGIRLYDQQYGLYEQSFSQLLGITVRRSAFDYYLLKQAVQKGVEFRSICKVIDVCDEKSEEKVKVYSDTQVIQAKKVIAADGINSTLVRRCGTLRKWRKWKTGFAVSTILNEHYPTALHKHTVDFFCIPFLGGFGWAFPLKHGYNIGVGCWSRYSKELIAFFQIFLKNFFQMNNLSSSMIHLEGCYIPAGGLFRTAAYGNILFAGDCAGFVDPFSGEGIYYAIRSGEIAAEEITRSLKGRGYPVAESYTQRCRREFSRDFKCSMLYSIMNGTKKSITADSVKAKRILEDMAAFMYNPHTYKDILLNRLFHYPPPTTRYPLK